MKIAKPWQTQTRTIINPILCPMCASSSKKWFSKEGCGICVCRGCDHVFADYDPPPDHVRRIYGDQYFFGGGNGYPNYLLEGKILRAHGRRYGRMLARHVKCGSVLDVGAAAGFVLQWHEFSPPSVLHWFSPASLRRMLAPYGLREVACGRPSKWIGGAHVKTLLQHKLKGGRAETMISRMLKTLPEGAALPYPAFDLFWVLYRKEES